MQTHPLKFLWPAVVAQELPHRHLLEKLLPSHFHHWDTLLPNHASPRLWLWPSII